MLDTFPVILAQVMEETCLSARELLVDGDFSRLLHSGASVEALVAYVDENF